MRTSGRLSFTSNLKMYIFNENGICKCNSTQKGLYITYHLKLKNPSSWGQCNSPLWAAGEQGVCLGEEGRPKQFQKKT
jgi:hypothetical protein